MKEYEICECTPLEDSIVLCSPVRLSAGDLEAVYIGPSGVFAVAPAEASPAALRNRLREVLGIPRVEVYVQRKGRYNALRNAFEGPLTDFTLTESIYLHTALGTPQWDARGQERATQMLRSADGLERGAYRGEDGVLYVRKQGKFYPLSDQDPDRSLLLALYGGVFGLHRFAMGKWASGLLYTLTGGLFGFGWLLDVLLCIFGLEKDKQKRLIGQPDRLSTKRYAIGFGTGLLCFLVYYLAVTALSGGMSNAFFDLGSKIDENKVNGIISTFSERFGK